MCACQRELVEKKNCKTNITVVKGKKTIAYISYRIIVIPFFRKNIYNSKVYSQLFLYINLWRNVKRKRISDQISFFLLHNFFSPFLFVLLVELSYEKLLKGFWVWCRHGITNCPCLSFSLFNKYSFWHITTTIPEPRKC